MRSHGAALFFPFLLVNMLLTPLPAQDRTRQSIAEAYRWNLAELYASDAAWNGEKERLAAEIPQARVFKGTLAQGPAQLATALDAQAAHQKTLQRLFRRTRVSCSRCRSLAPSSGRPGHSSSPRSLPWSRARSNVTSRRTPA